MVGATGLVGRMMLEVLHDRAFPVDELILAASDRSLGRELPALGETHKVVSLKEALAGKPQLALFSAGRKASFHWAPEFANAGAFVIDNSSAWRMHPEYKLIVPEINAHLLTAEDKIIANPNCSTIQMVMALAPLHAQYGIRRIVVSTYQAVTGSGMPAVKQLDNERQGRHGDMAYPHPIDLNCFPCGGDFLHDGSTTEEEKLVNETRKILGDEEIGISATVARIPVKGGHSESVNVELKREFELDDVRNLLNTFPGLELMDDPDRHVYPTPLQAAGRDAVYVGRVRRDASAEKTLNLWVVSDNLRKGAATNAIQIAEYLLRAGLLNA